jgi:hypothetical protein
VSGPTKNPKVEKARENEMDFLDKVEPELVRTLPQSFQKLIEMMRKVKIERDLRRSEP